MLRQGINLSPEMLATHFGSIYPLALASVPTARVGEPEYELLHVERLSDTGPPEMILIHNAALGVDRLSQRDVVKVATAPIHAVTFWLA